MVVLMNEDASARRAYKTNRITKTGPVINNLGYVQSVLGLTYAGSGGMWRDSADILLI